ncbi:CocE/NonD family hydrolase [Microbacterium sp.]|uniref:CocE/NonD family hydrolase n=1 Tax=Microbacterium sp. TaxID=51671 RepID=UPI00334192E9
MTQKKVFRVPFRIPMRDGVTLAADRYTLDPSRTTPQPVVLQRTCYDRNWPSYVDAATALAREGYAAVVVETRGRNDSEGEWRAHASEAVDGYDTIEWLAAQPFSDGRVGTLGGSYSGWVQLAAESTRPPSLATMIVTSSHLQLMQAYGRDRDFRMPRALTWLHQMSHRNMRPIDDVDWEEVLRRQPLEAAGDDLGEVAALWREWMGDPALRASDPVHTGAEVRIDVPTLHISGWEDEPGQTDVYTRAVASGSPGQYLLVGPWDHPGTRNPQRVTRGRDHGDEAVVDMHAVYLAWFDRWLRGDGEAVGDDHRAAVFIGGRSQWAAYPQWPAAGEIVELRLGEDGGLSAERDLPLELVHDPADPVAAHRTLEYSDIAAANSLLALDRHPHVLALTGDVQEEPLLVSGVVEVEIEAEADGTRDWCVWLADVDEAGIPVRVSANGSRIVHDGARSTATVALGPVAHEFAPGHRLRLYLGGSNFPIWDVLGWHDRESGSAAPSAALVHGVTARLAIDRAPLRVRPDQAPLGWTRS